MGAGRAAIWLSVAVGRQRQGIGSRLLAAAEDALREDGCRRIHTHSGSPKADGDAATEFARARGYRQTLLDLRQDLQLPVPSGTLDRLDTHVPSAASDEYEILTAVDRLPEEWLEDRGHLARRMSTDAPMGDIDLDEQEWDADRVRRQWNSGGLGRGVEAVARHRATGRLVGFTDIILKPASPKLAVQADTLVLSEHRGHGLGLVLKTANLSALVREIPEATVVRTWNADTNTHMLAITMPSGSRSLVGPASGSRTCDRLLRRRLGSASCLTSTDSPPAPSTPVRRPTN